jgi:hypothetical protein
LLILESSELNQTVGELEKNFSHLKSEASKVNNQVNLNLSSHNDGMTIWELANAQGIEAALFNSLHLNFSFIKSDTIVKFLEVLLAQIGVANFSSMVKSFYRLNVELNMASGSELAQYPNVKLHHPP